MDTCQMCDERIRLSIFWKGWCHSATADPKCANGHGVAVPKAAQVVLAGAEGN